MQKTGTGGGESATNVHLHLEVFNVEGLEMDDIINKEQSLIWARDHRLLRRDPLNREEK